MIVLALATPLVAMLGMIALARIEDSLDRLAGQGHQERHQQQHQEWRAQWRRERLVPAHVPGTVRLRRSGPLWVLAGNGAELGRCDPKVRKVQKDRKNQEDRQGAGVPAGWSGRGTRAATSSAPPRTWTSGRIPAPYPGAVQAPRVAGR